jgi:predicted dehydrogenase
MTTTPVRVGLIGAGGIAGAHVAGYRRNPDVVTLAAVADPVAENAERRAADVGARVFADYREMLEVADIDAVDICLPHHLHADAIVAAARAGKHVLCEKPLCLTEAEAARIEEAVADSGVTVMCAHNQLFLPAVAKARELIDSGALGEVYEVRTTDSFFNDFTPENMGWRADSRASGGGELIDTGYHPTYLLMHLAGARPTEVTAMLSRHRLGFMEGEDSAQVLVRFENDVVGSIVTSWAYQATPNTERFSVVGEAGSLHSDGTTLQVTRRGGETETIAFEPVHEFAAEVRHFATSIAAGTRPIHTQEEGISVLGIILAAYESARTHAIVPVRATLGGGTAAPVLATA